MQAVACASTYVLAIVIDPAARLPDIGLADPEARAAFIAAATGIVRALARPGHRDEDTWINILHARDGAWGVGGRVLTSDDLVAGIMAAAGPPVTQPALR